MWDELSKKLPSPEQQAALESYKSGAGYTGNNAEEDNYYRKLAGGAVDIPQAPQPQPQQMFQNIYAKEVLPAPLKNETPPSGYQHFDPTLTPKMLEKFKKLDDLGDKLENYEVMIDMHQRRADEDPNYKLMPGFHQLVKDRDDLEDKMTSDPDFEHYQKVLTEKYGPPPK